MARDLTPRRTPTVVLEVLLVISLLRPLPSQKCVPHPRDLVVAWLASSSKRISREETLSLTERTESGCKNGEERVGYPEWTAQSR